MGLSQPQIKALQRRLSGRHIRRREAAGKQLCYIEGWHAIAEANRIFGFDGWDRETLEFKCVAQREARGTAMAAYVTKVRITVRTEGRTIIREGHGSGEATGATPGEAHDMALKTAETDATKRALATFGRPFGLGLYLGEHPGRTPVGAARKLEAIPEAPTRVPNQDTPASPAAATALPPHSKSRSPASPIPEATQALLGSDNKPAGANAGPAGRAAAATRVTSGLASAQVMPINRPLRRRDRRHLIFVASHPCLICGREPADAHHLRFTQPRALGRKVSDEFTVPLCRTHHRQLHDDPREQEWWEVHGIDPLEIAHDLWVSSHSGAGTADADADPPESGQGDDAPPGASAGGPR